MARTLLIRGMLAGLLAGLLCFAFARVAGEPAVDRSIMFESALDDAKAKAAEQATGLRAVEEPPLVSREVQAGLGLFTGVVVYATALGGLFGLVFAVVDRRVVNLRPRSSSALLAASAFVAVYLVPNLKYPASPPAVGQADTIGERTALYFIMLAASIGSMAACSVLRKRLATQLDEWHAALIAGASYVVAMIVVACFLPGISEIPETFPAEVLWQFRVASLGMQAILWTTIGLAFGTLSERAMAAHGGGAWAGLRPNRPAG